MKKLLVLIFGSVMIVGCGASLHESRWTESYCVEHRMTYNHAALQCRDHAHEPDCLFRAEWRAHCRISSRAMP